MLIRCDNLQKSYTNGADTHVVLKGINLSIEEAECIAIIGSSGSGKTTLLNLLGGLDTDYTGSLQMQGRELKSFSDSELSAFRNETIGYVFQSFQLLEHLSCIQNVMLPAAFLRQKPSFSLETRAQEVLETVGIGHKANDHPMSLSGGQRQRVAIARALFLQPRILLCDEPTGNLDRSTGEQILGLFLELQKKQNITLVLITHEEHIARATQRQIRLEQGILQQDTRSIAP